MSQINDTPEALQNLGRRLRNARLNRNETMALFAQRLGVSERTVRAMERGSPSVQVGTWFDALWLLDRLNETDHLIETRESLIDRARAQDVPRRQRASRRSL